MVSLHLDLVMESAFFSCLLIAKVFIGKPLPVNVWGIFFLFIFRDNSPGRGRGGVGGRERGRREKKRERKERGREERERKKDKVNMRSGGGNCIMILTLEAV